MAPPDRHTGARILAAVAIVMALSAAAADRMYDTYEMRIEVAPNGTCHEDIDLRIRNIGTAPLRNAFFTVMRNVSSIAVRGAGEDLSWTVAEDEWLKLVNITFEYPIPPGMDRGLSISFDTSQFVVRDGDALEFRTTYNPSSPISSFSLSVVLPPGYVLPVGEVAAQARTVLSPPAELRTDGQHLILVWRREDVAADDAIGVFARFTRPRAEAAAAAPACPPLTAQGLGIGAILGAAALWACRRATRKRPSVLSVFTADEQAVVAAMARAGGSMKQRDLLAALDMSKSKLSRLVMDLESRGVLRKERMGNVNRLALREDLRHARLEREGAAGGAGHA